MRSPRRPKIILAFAAAVLALAVCAAPALSDMQCTTWAHAKRPDLPWKKLGDAKTWDSRAAELGFTVDRTPAAGASPSGRRASAPATTTAAPAATATSPT